MPEPLFQGPPKGTEEIISEPKASPQGPPKGDEEGTEKNKSTPQKLNKQ